MGNLPASVLPGSRQNHWRTENPPKYYFIMGYTGPYKRQWCFHWSLSGRPNEPEYLNHMSVNSYLRQYLNKVTSVIWLVYFVSEWWSYRTERNPQSSSWALWTQNLGQVFTTKVGLQFYDFIYHICLYMDGVKYRWGGLFTGLCWRLNHCCNTCTCTWIHGSSIALGNFQQCIIAIPYSAGPLIYLSCNCS